MNRQQLEQNIENLVRSKVRPSSSLLPRSLPDASLPPQGELTIVSDARVCFLRDADLERLGGPEKLGPLQRLQTITQRQVFLKHSYTTPLTPTTALVATTQVTARQGSGAGNLLLKLQHTPSQRLSLEMGTTLLRPRALTLKATYAPDPDSFVRVDVPVRTLDAPPKFNVVLGRRIYERTTGTITLRSGAWALGRWGEALLQPYSDSTLSVGLSHVTGWGVEATAAMFVKQVSVSWGRTVLGGFKVGVQGVVTNVGAASVGVSADRRVTENCKAGMGLEVAANGAMTVKLRCVGSPPFFKTSLCVSLTPSPDALQLLSARSAHQPPGHHLVGPRLPPLCRLHGRAGPRHHRDQPTRPRAAQAQAVERVRRPLPRARAPSFPPELTLSLASPTHSKLKELRKEHAEYIREKRKEALDAQALLAEHVKKRVREEEAKEGACALRLSLSLSAALY